MADLTGVGPGIVRAAETVLRSAGGQSVMLRMPLAAVSGVLGEQLGLPTATFSDQELAPVVIRALGASSASDGARWELLVGATTAAGLAGDGSVASALALFAQAIGVVVDDELFRVESVKYQSVGTAVYLFRVELRETESATV